LGGGKLTEAGSRRRRWDRRQGRGEVVLVARLRRRKRGRGERKGAGGIGDVFYRRDMRQGKEGGVRGRVRVEERDRRREGGP
jgi:hypothetical protein